MKHIVIAPDSFKGTLDAQEICTIISDTVHEHLPDADITCIPMADGGEGLVNAYLQALGGVKREAVVTGPNGKPVRSEYGILGDMTAVMEMAACAGLPLMGNRLDPMHATTYGVGELLREISLLGIRRVLIGVGGSATNDMGIGMAAALGYEFLDKDYQLVEPMPYNLGRIEHIRKPREELKLQITVACDVDNPLCGPNGATYTFGKQKGIPEEKMEELDQNICHFAQVIEREFSTDIRHIPGAGAAGGLAAALIAFLHAELKPGIELFLDTIGFDELLKSTDLVFTGEGRIDWQSMAGKVPIGISRRCAKAKVPCVALCGSVGLKAELAYKEGMAAIFSSVRDFNDSHMNKEDYAENLRFLTDSVMRVMMLRMGGGTVVRSDLAGKGA